MRRKFLICLFIFLNIKFFIFSVEEKIKTSNEAKKELIRQKIINIAVSLLGTEYWPGGQDTDYGMDCSGFTQYVYNQVGIKIPRTAFEQYIKAGKVSKKYLKKGDLVFFSTRGIGINHVGIYIGDNKFIHAPGVGKFIKIDYLNNRYWAARFIIGGTYIF